MQKQLKKIGLAKKQQTSKREKRTKPNNYPVMRVVPLKELFKSYDLYKGIAYFIVMQLIIFTISVGVTVPHYGDESNVIAILIGIILVIMAIREIIKRQRANPDIGKFSIARVICTFSTLLVTIIIMSAIFNQLGIIMPQQPNQATLNGIMVQIPIATIFTIVIVAPIVEELVFRELLPYATGPSYVSFIITTILFTVIHAPFGLLGWINYTIVATAFLYARLRGNNLYTSIAVHMLWNILSIIIQLNILTVLI